MSSLSFSILLLIVLQDPADPVPPAGCPAYMLERPVASAISVPAVLLSRQQAREAIRDEAPTVVRTPARDITVLVWFLIDEGGAVRRALVADSSGLPDFDAAAVAAARRFRFKPARYSGSPVCMWIRLPVRF